ncbi:hypothetical protein FKM82_016015 [Ascaphus truei]
MPTQHSHVHSTAGIRADSAPGVSEEVMSYSWMSFLVLRIPDLSPLLQPDHLIPDILVVSLSVFPSW